MASLYSRPGSPYWFLKRKDRSGKWISSSTGLRVEHEIESAQAKVLCAQATLAETGNASPSQAGWGWVEGWMATHWANPASAKRQLNRWRHIEHWLAIEGLSHPSMIEFRHGAELVAWREGRVARHRVCGRNTAIADAKLLGQIMQVAVQRGMIKANPIRKLGIAKLPPAEKRELTDAEIERCVAGLENETDWMRLCFLIGLHTGCRLRETALRMDMVDFKRGTITFPTPKGGRKRAFSRPLPPELENVLKPLVGQVVSHSIPAHASRSFKRFFKRHKVEGVTFHNLRVSYVTRLHRAGVPLSAAMRLVNHSSEIVHEIYNRLSVDDVMPWRHVSLYPSTIAGNPAAEPTAQPSGKLDPSPSGKRSCKPPARSRRVP